MYKIHLESTDEDYTIEVCEIYSENNEYAGHRQIAGCLDFLELKIYDENKMLMPSSFEDENCEEIQEKLKEAYIERSL